MQSDTLGPSTTTFAARISPWRMDSIASQTRSLFISTGSRSWTTVTSVRTLLSAGGLAACAGIHIWKREAFALGPECLSTTAFAVRTSPGKCTSLHHRTDLLFIPTGSRPWTTTTSVRTLPSAGGLTVCAGIHIWKARRPNVTSRHSMSGCHTIR